MKKYILPVITLALASALQAQVTHNLVVEDLEGNKTTFPAANVAKVEFQEMPSYITAPYMLSAVYSSSDNLGTYEVQFATDEPDISGDPSTIGGIQILMSFTGPKSVEAIRAVLPAGMYKAGAGGAFTFSPEQSACWVRVAEGSEGVSVLPVIGGAVDVRHTGEGYDIRMELLTLDGSSVNVSYEGAITFSLGSSEYQPFTEAQDVTMDGLQGRFYGNWFYPFSDDATLQCYNGTFTAEGAQIDGYWLNLSLYMPKCENPMDPAVKLVDGVYNIENRDMPRNNTYLPFTYSHGSLIEFYGEEYPSGTYLIHTGADGTRKIGYISSGTVTISDQGRSLILEGLTEQGVSIKCRFTGTPNVHNYCDNNKTEPERPWSSIDKDVNLSFIPATIGFFYQDDEIVPGLTTWTMQIQDPEAKAGDYMMLSILGPSEFADGTYNVATAFDSMTAFPGWMTYSGDMIHSWYGDLSSQDDEGYASDFVCITSGTFTVTTIDEATFTRKVTFDLTGDNGHKVVGEYNGVLIDATDLLNQMPAKKGLRARIPRR